MKISRSQNAWLILITVLIVFIFLPLIEKLYIVMFSDKFMTQRSYVEQEDFKLTSAIHFSIVGAKVKVEFLYQRANTKSYNKISY